MAHWDDARIAIENRLATNWATTPIRYWSSGVPFDPKPGVAYIALQITDVTGNQVSLGSGSQLHRYAGLIILQILVPERGGPKVADQYCDTLDDLFRRATFSHGSSGTIVCRTPQKTVVGVQDGWYQVNLVVPFRRDKIH